MTTAADIIDGAAKLLGIVRKGEALDGDESADGLKSLNGLLGSWSNDSLLCISRVSEDFTLTASTSSYTIGSGDTFNTTRPIQIIAATVRQGNTDYPLEIVTDETYWRDISDKSSTSTIPTHLNYNNAYDTGTIKVYPVPSVSMTITLLSEKPITELASSSTTVTFPPGWERALKYNLAVEMAPEYGIDPSEVVLRNALESKASIMEAISKNRPLSFQPSTFRYSLDNDI